MPNCYRGTEVPPRLTGEKDGLQIWRAAANIAYFINSRGQPTMCGPPVSVLGEGLNSHRISDLGTFFNNGENRNAYVILMGNPEGKSPLGKPSRRWEVILASQKKRTSLHGVSCPCRVL